MNEQNSSTPARPFSLWLYILIVFSLSWPFQIIAAIWGTELLPRYSLHATSMFMVTVGTFIAGRYVFRDGFAGAGWRWGKPRHYLAVVGLVLLLWAVPTLVDLSVGTLTLPTGLTGTQTTWIFVLLFVTLIPAFGEEFGWRGYMLPRLLARHSVRKAVLIHALVWWVWHLPVLVGVAVQVGIASAGEMGLPVSVAVPVTVTGVIIIGAVPAVLHGVVFAYIWTRSRSLAVATVYHAAFDGVRDSIHTTIGGGPIAGAWAAFLLCILGILFLWKGKWETLEPTRQLTETPEVDNG